MRQGGKSLLGYLPGHPGSWPDEVLDSIIAGLRAARAQVAQVETLATEMLSHKDPGVRAYGAALWAILHPGAGPPAAPPPC